MTPEMERKQKLRSWAVAITQDDQPADAFVLAAAEFIKKEIPALTMEDIRWDEEKHKYAIANCPSRRVVMLKKQWSGHAIECLVLGSYRVEQIPVEELTPTGEQFVLQTVDNQF